MTEILTACVLTGSSLPGRVATSLERALTVFPRSPIEGPAGDTSDVAGALLLERLGLVALADRVDTTGRQPPDPPPAWPGMLLWAAATSALCVPGLHPDADKLVQGRETDLERAACLAAMQRRGLACSRVLRWLAAGSCEKDLPPLVTQLSRYLHLWSDDEPRLAYELRVLGARPA